MASRLVQRHREATMLVTERVLNQALYEIRALFALTGHDDPRAKELKQLYNDIAPYAREKSDPDFYDDASHPDVAAELKAAVDRVVALKDEISRPAQDLVQAPAKAPVRQEVRSLASTKTGTANIGHLSCPYCEHGGFKNQEELDNHTDTDHKGRLASKNAEEKGAPMSSKLFARKRKVVEAEDEMLDAAPEAVAGDAPTEPLPTGEAVPEPAAAPAPAPVAPPTAGNSFANLPTEALTAVAEALTKVEAWETNPAILGAIEQVAEELKNRPMTPAPAEGAPKAASKKTAVAPPGREDQVKALKKEPGIDNPWAVAWNSYNESHEGAADAAPAGWEETTGVMQSAGMPAPQANVLAHWMQEQDYTPHKAAFLIRRGRLSVLKSKFAATSAGVPPVNEDTLNKVEGQPHEVPEIGEAHGKREGVEQAEKHDSHPGDGVATIKSPQDMEKQAKADSEISKALKTAEQLEKKLGELYLDAKPLVAVNAAAAIRDAVESIYDSKNKFAEAKKVLNKHEMQAQAEEEAQEKALDKGKKASTGGLALVAAE
jgi:hypothetical protein